MITCDCFLCALFIFSTCTVGGLSHGSSVPPFRSLMVSLGHQYSWSFVTFKATAYDWYNFHSHKTIQWAFMSNRGGHGHPGSPLLFQAFLSYVSCLQGGSAWTCVSVNLGWSQKWWGESCDMTNVYFRICYRCVQCHCLESMWVKG